MTSSTRIALLVVLALAGTPSLAAAQWGGFTDRLKEKVKDRASRAQDEAMDAGLDHAEDEVKSAAKRGASGDGEGKTSKSGSKGGDAAAKQRVGEGAWANYDFVPGERVLFAEDYAKDRIGNFPKRLEFVQGDMELVDWNGQRFLRATSKSTFKIPLPEKLHERFTVELDLTIPWWGFALYGGPDGDVGDDVAGQVRHAHVYVSGTEAGLRADGRSLATLDPRDLYEGKKAEEITGHLVRLRIHGDGRYVKVYLDEHRVSNVPNADFLRTNALFVETEGFPPGQEESDRIPTLIGRISVNAGGREMYDALMSDGRFATQGIFFDTGSDRIRPESTPTLKEIAAMLEEHPELTIRIEGHTDDVGNAGSNQQLSEKRAAAVKAHLVSSGVAAKRLEARGLGSTKPVAPNTSPEGRQNNRRVELVKL